MIRYEARKADPINYQPGAWTGKKIQIFQIEGDQETQIGEYQRDYPAFFLTFFPFRINDKDLALYSPHYTGTRIMELPSCRDIGGEEPNAFGFCPVEYYVPGYVQCASSFTQGRSYRVNQPTPEQMKNAVGPLQFYEFGFVAGCIWGEDSSWKIQYLDLSQADKGILTREEKFGYIELPANVTLEQAIELVDFGHDPDEDYSYEIAIAVRTFFDMRTGKQVTQ